MDRNLELPFLLARIWTLNLWPVHKESSKRSHQFSINPHISYLSMEAKALNLFEMLCISDERKQSSLANLHFRHGEWTTIEGKGKPNPSESSDQRKVFDLTAYDCARTEFNSVIQQWQRSTAEFNTWPGHQKNRHWTSKLYTAVTGHAGI